jgi:hypothetical protein
LPVAATSLADHIPGLGDQAASSLALISIRTLLPLVGLVRAFKRRALEVPNAAGDHALSTDSSSTPGENSPSGGVGRLQLEQQVPPVHVLAY